MGYFLISIIIPCYNVSAYIDRCLQSIVSQTIGLESLEIICVNDASTDDTLSKLQRWEAQYPDNVIVITYDENMRQGGARNIGISYATAPFIGFVDSDDWIDANMYKDLYESIISTKVKIAKCKMIRDLGDTPLPPITSQENQTFHFSKRGAFYYAVPQSTGINGDYGCIGTALYNREWLLNTGVSFPEHLAYEDNYWNAVLSLYVESMSIIDYPYYHYYINPNSTVNSQNAAHQLDRLITEKMIIDYYKSCGAFDLFYQELLQGFVKRYYLNTLHILFTRFQTTPPIVYEMTSTVASLFPDWQRIYPQQTITICEKLLLNYLEIATSDPTLTETVCVNELKKQYLLLLTSQ